TIHDVLPHIHQQAIEATGGTCAVLFEVNPRTQALQATSGYATASLDTTPWTLSDGDAIAVEEAFTRGTPIGVMTATLPELSRRLDTPAAWLVPLARA